MPKFRKKPVVIEAWQWDGYTGYGDRPQTFQHENISMQAGMYDGQAALLIHTLEGVMTARPRDWIIQGVNGEFYPCKPDIFEKTYEPVE